MKKILLTIFLIVLSVVVLSEQVSFFYTGKASDVKLISDYNNFIPVPLTLEATDFWKTDLDIPEGRYHYLFIVDGKETIDYSNSDIASLNNKLYNIRNIFSSSNFLKGDGNVSSLNFITVRKFINPVRQGEIYISIEAASEDLEDITIQANASEIEKQIISTGETSLFRFHIITPANILKYRFIIKDGKDIVYGINGSETFFEFDFLHPVISYFDTPLWSKGGVFYQIFPERFKNGDTKNDPKNARKWVEKYTRETLSNGYYGGDLKGILDSVPYLKDLGINAVYFNPIFEADSTHKYNTTDYLKIDPSFGNESIFDSLLSDLHKNNIKVVLDGVFNHTGVKFFAMQENFKKQKDSRFLDWYYINSFPIKESTTSYKAWFNYASLPQLKNSNPEVRAFISEVSGKWLSKGIDGWRLDAVDQVPDSYWEKTFYPSVKSVNPNALITGEFWRDATQYYEAPAFDSVMNYIFRDAVISYAKGGNGKGFENSINTYILKYPPQALHSLWNMVDSHDTVRLMSELGNDIEKFKLAVGIHLMFIGSPVIYYGDEIGMDSSDETGNPGGDPYCRKPFIQDKSKWNMDLLNYYKKLIALRNEHQAVKTGTYNVLMTKGGVFAFERVFKNDRVVVITNSKSTSSSIDFDLGDNYKEILTGKNYNKVTEIPPKSIMIFVK